MRLFVELLVYLGNGKLNNSIDRYAAILTELETRLYILCSIFISSSFLVFLFNLVLLLKILSLNILECSVQLVHVQLVEQIGVHRAGKRAESPDAVR